MYNPSEKWNLMLLKRRIQQLVSGVETLQNYLESLKPPSAPSSEYVSATVAISDSLSLMTAVLQSLLFELAASQWNEGSTNLLTLQMQLQRCSLVLETYERFGRDVGPPPPC